MRTIAALSAALTLAGCSMNPPHAGDPVSSPAATGSELSWSLSTANQRLSATRHEMEEKAAGEYRGLYFAGVEALACMESVSLPTAASIDRIAGSGRDRLREALEGLGRTIAAASVAGKRPVDLELALSIARDRQAAGYQALAAANRILGAEAPMAAEVKVATDRIRRAVNSRLNDFQGSTADIVAAARPVVRLGVSTMTEVQSQLTRVADSRRASQLPAGAVSGSDGSADAINELETQGQQLLSAIAMLQAAIEGPAHSARAAASACKMDEIGRSVALQALPAGELSVQAGETRSFAVHGGKGPYTAYFVGAHPEKLELVVPSSADGSFALRALAGVPDGKPFTLLVQDFGSSAQAVITGKTVNRSWHRPARRR